MISGGGPVRAPGGINSTRTAVGVSSLSDALAFYRDVLGFTQVRSSASGVSAAVVEVAPGQHLELIEGSTSRPDSLAVNVEDAQRWKDHFGSIGVSAEAEGPTLVIYDPDGLRIVLE